jgi:hypothetical protein
MAVAGHGTEPIKIRPTSSLEKKPGLFHPPSLSFSNIFLKN